MKIIIELEVKDPETAEAYADIDESFIEDDIMNGDLLEACRIYIVRVER